jgi:hypothetical protein
MENVHSTLIASTVKIAPLPNLNFKKKKMSQIKTAKNCIKPLKSHTSVNMRSALIEKMKVYGIQMASVLQNAQKIPF